MTIRRAQADDLAAIIALYALDPLKGAREVVSDPPDRIYQDAFAEIARDPNQILLVAEEEGAIAGTLQLTIIPYLLLRAQRRALVEAVFVHPDRQGRAIGRALMLEAIQIAREHRCAVMKLTSDKRRPRAHAFYEKLGFRAGHEGFSLALETAPPPPGTEE